ncbi:MAG: TlpA disulfide reductase family protein [Mariprofundales bacterium]
MIQNLRSFALPLLASLIVASTPTPVMAQTLVWQAGDTTAQLADYQGQPLILHFWASWCPPCRQELPQLDAWKQAHPKARLVVVSLDDSMAEATQFLRRNHLSLPAWTTDSMQAMRLGVRGLPTTMLVDSNGEIQQRMVGARDWEDHDFSKRMLAWSRPPATAHPRP